MSHPPADELADLETIAHHIREGIHERGHRISVAASVDRAFRNSRFTKLGRRNLVEDLAGQYASQVGFDFRSVGGGGFELRRTQGIHDRRYRLRYAKLNRHGELIIRASNDAALGDPEALLVEESWVFAWRSRALDQIDDICVAEVLGKTRGRPGNLVLGPIFPLNGTHFPTGGFQPADDPLDDIGFGDDVAGTA